MADALVAARGERICTALQGMGVDLRHLGPALSWLPAARGGTGVPLGLDERAGLRAYLGITSTSCVASDAACDRTVRQLETFGVLLEMRAEDITVMTHAGQMSAGQLRAIREEIRAVQGGAGSA
ncbi:hypothetical protein [Streptomyces sasae]|uniref:hypothetical protein n=1 Tax=Streptomyces sasae TaxID=1266772 RepID=UPI00292EFD28|nr:hypothetical protein [Streptomyces sasae]